MENQEFWIPVYAIDRNLQITNDNCIKVKIPKICDKCNCVLSITNGSKDIPTCFYTACEHFAYYQQVWQNRIIEETDSIANQVVKKSSCGGYCTGCNLYNEYQEEKYVCFGCKENPYRKKIM